MFVFKIQGRGKWVGKVEYLRDWGCGVSRGQETLVDHPPESERRSWIGVGLDKDDGLDCEGRNGERFEGFHT